MAFAAFVVGSLLGGYDAIEALYLSFCLIFVVYDEVLERDLSGAWKGWLLLLDLGVNPGRWDGGNLRSRLPGVADL